jgi:hypothetical protein
MHHAYRNHTFMHGRSCQSTTNRTAMAVREGTRGNGAECMQSGVESQRKWNEWKKDWSEQLAESTGGMCQVTHDASKQLRTFEQTSKTSKSIVTKPSADTENKLLSPRNARKRGRQSDTKTEQAMNESKHYE